VDLILSPDRHRDTVSFLAADSSRGSPLSKNVQLSHQQMPNSSLPRKGREKLSGCDKSYLNLAIVNPSRPFSMRTTRVVKIPWRMARYVSLSNIFYYVSSICALGRRRAIPSTCPCPHQRTGSRHLYQTIASTTTR
jgi:hypothetical protein